MIRLATRTGRILFTHFSSSFFDIFGLIFTDGSIHHDGTPGFETSGRLGCRGSLGLGSMAGRTRTARPVPRFRGAVVGPHRETSPHPNLSALVSLPCTSSMRWSCVPLTVFPCSVSLISYFFSFRLCAVRVDFHLMASHLVIHASRPASGEVFSVRGRQHKKTLQSFESCRYGQARRRTHTKSLTT